jgi:hypothetical protein
MQGGGLVGMIWGRLEVPATNIILDHVKFTGGSRGFEVYNGYGIQFRDSQMAMPTGIAVITIFNAGILLTNTTGTNGTVATIDGLTSTNSLTLLNTQASLTASNVLGANPITLAAATLTISNNLDLPANTVLNFALGTNASTVVSTGALTLNATLNLSAADGFGPGSYRLFNYGVNRFGAPAVGTTPSTSGHAWLYNLQTNIGGQVNFVVSIPSPPVFDNVQLSDGTNLVMSGSSTATNLNYFILSSTNVALPRNQWSLVGSNQFNGSGGFSFTNVISAEPSQNFFLLQYP